MYETKFQFMVIPPSTYYGQGVCTLHVVIVKQFMLEIWLLQQKLDMVIIQNKSVIR